MNQLHSVVESKNEMAKYTPAILEMELLTSRKTSIRKHLKYII